MTKKLASWYQSTSTSSKRWSALSTNTIVSVCLDSLLRRPWKFSWQTTPSNVVVLSACRRSMMLVTVRFYQSFTSSSSRGKIKRNDFFGYMGLATQVSRPSSVWLSRFSPLSSSTSSRATAQWMIPPKKRTGLSRCPLLMSLTSSQRSPPSTLLTSSHSLREREEWSLPTSTSSLRERW